MHSPAIRRRESANDNPCVAARPERSPEGRRASPGLWGSVLAAGAKTSRRRPTRPASVCPPVGSSRYVLLPFLMVPTRAPVTPPTDILRKDEFCVKASFGGRWVAGGHRLVVTRSGDASAGSGRASGTPAPRAGAGRPMTDRRERRLPARRSPLTGETRRRTDRSSHLKYPDELIVLSAQLGESPSVPYRWSGKEIARCAPTQPPRPRGCPSRP